MKEYKVNYIIQTKSRYGSYNYKNSDTVEAENKEDAVLKAKELYAKTNDHKKYKFMLLSVRNI